MEGKKHNYILRDIPEDLWIRAKHLAIDNGISFRELILSSLNTFIKQEKKK